MRRRLGIVALVLVLALMIAVPSTFAQGRPHVMATGSIWVELPEEPDGIPTHIVFNARGAEDWSATGHLFWFEDGEEYKLDIFMTGMVFPDCVYMAGNVYSGPDGHDRENLCFIVCDDGTPGAGGSSVYLAVWNDDPEWGYFGLDVLRGNIVILD